MGEAEYNILEKVRKHIKGNIKCVITQFPPSTSLHVNYSGHMQWIIVGDRDLAAATIDKGQFLAVYTPCRGWASRENSVCIQDDELPK